jgi:hypothetical protein
MSEETKVLSIQVDTKSAIKNIKAAEKEIEELRQGFAELSKEEQENTEVKEKFNSSIRVLNKEIRSNRRVLDESIKTSKDASEATKAQEGSLVQMRAQLKLMTRQYENLSGEERDNTDAGRQLGIQVRELTEDLKSKEKAIGDNRRNVGNYTDSIVQAAGSIRFMGVNLGQVVNNLKSTRAGLNQNVRGFSNLRVAIIKTGIGVLVIALGSVITYLTQMQEGMDRVSKIMAGVRAGVQVLRDAFAQFGKEVLQDLAMRFSALGDIIMGLLTLDFERMKNGLSDITQSGNFTKISLTDLGMSMIEAAKAAAELERRTQELRDATIAAIADDQRRRNEINALAAQYRDEGIALEERLEMLDRASELESELHAEQLQRAKERFLIEKQRQALSESTAEDLERLANLEADYIKLQGESNMLQITIQRRRSRIINQVQRQEEQAAQAIIQAREREAQERLKIEQALEDAIIENMDDGFDKQMRKMQVQHERRLMAITGNSEEEKELRRQLEIAFQKELDKIYDEQQAIEEARTQEELTLIEKRAKARLQLELMLLDEETQAFFDKQIEIEEFERQQRLDKIANEIEDEELRATEIERINLESEQRITELRDQQQQLRLDNEERINQARVLAEQETFKALQSLAQLAADLGEGGAAFAKTLALFEIGANSAKAVAQAVANAQQAAAAGGPAAPFLAAAYTASGIASVLTAVSRARNLLNSEKQPKAPKLAEGGGIQLGGKSHSSGGTPIYAGSTKVAEAEKGENLYVLKKSASDYINSLSGLNQAFGGRSFDASRSGRFQDGGAVAMQANNDVVNKIDLVEATRAAVSGLPQPIVRVTEINQVQSDVSRGVEVSGL